MLSPPFPIKSKIRENRQDILTRGGNYEPNFRDIARLQEKRNVYDNYFLPPIKLIYEGA